MDHAAECDEEDDIDPKYIDFAGSDSILSESNYESYPDLQMYPTVAGAVTVVYNLNHIMDSNEELVLTMSIVSQIFMFNITSWSDQQILDANSDSIASKLTNMTDPTIKVCVRSSKSGTTEIFTKALADSSPTFASRVGGSSLPNWVESPNLYRKGSSAVGAFVDQNDGAVGYLVLGEAEMLGLSQASFQQGAYTVKADSKSLLYAVSEPDVSFGNNGDDPDHLTADLYGPKADLAWPIAGYTYLVMRKTTTREGGSCAHRQAVVKFWDWFYTSDLAASYASSYGFSPLSFANREMVLNRLRQDIYCDDGSLAYGDLEIPTILKLSAPAFLLSEIEDINKVVAEASEYSVNLITNASASEYSLQALDTGTIDVTVASLLAADESNDNVMISPFVGIAFAVAFNLDDAGIEYLILNVDLIQDIFSGLIDVWNHPDITELNPSLETVNASIAVIPPSEQVVAELNLVLEARYGYSLEYSGTYAEEEMGSVLALIDSDYSISLVHSYQMISVSFASIVGSDGSTAIAPSTTSIFSCGQDTYTAERNSFDFPRSDNTSCYPLSLDYYIFTNRDDFVDEEDGGCDDGSRPALKAQLAWWYLAERNVDSALAQAGYVPIAAYNDDVHQATYDALMQLTCNGVSLLTLFVDYTLLPASASGFAIGIATLTFSAGAGFLAWMMLNLKHKIVRFSQPAFMGILILGCILLTSALIPMALDDRSYDYYKLGEPLPLHQDFSALDAACQSIPWLFCVGFAMIFSALFAKVWRLKKIMGSKKLKRVKLTTMQLIPWVAGMVGLSMLVLGVWQGIAPLHWERVPVAWDEDGMMVKSYGRCTSAAFSEFFWLFVAAQFGALLYGMVLCYQTRYVQSEFMEGKWINIILINMVTTLMFSVLLGFFVKDQPSAIFAVATVNATMLGFGTMMLMCVPKCWTHYLSVKDPNVLKNAGAYSSGDQATTGGASKGTTTKGFASSKIVVVAPSVGVTSV
uniref:G-protein coupled receptors family 3 profile domain-containing protein n=1 Tax=Heterosigma akashiwo TaxID=2829 RepID=A0A7S4DDI4_HETAK